MRRSFRNILSTLYSLLNTRRGFTVLELLIFSAIFAFAAVAFIAILTSVTRVQVRQGAAAEVSHQSQFLLQTIQRYVEQSSLVELAADAATTTLKLRMASSTFDPTYIFVSGTAMYVRETSGGVAQPLTSERVTVSNVSFVKRENAGGRDSVSVLFTIEYNTLSPQQRFSQSLRTAVARVSAATFDSNVIPSVNNTYKLGTAAQDWQSINGTVYFSGSNVGVGVSSPNQTLEVNGGVRINTTTGKPACGSSQRGTFWVVQAGSGVKDDVQVCVKNATDTYMWAVIY